MILAIRIVAKCYAGELVELARKVQDQWVSAEEHARKVNADALEETEDLTIVQQTAERRRGPLEPAHLREAIRRLRLTRDGGLAGQLDLWKKQQSSGVERFGMRNLGKRLLR